MPWGDLLAHTVALVVYPGGLALVAVGLPVEYAVRRLIEGGRVSSLSLLAALPRLAFVAPLLLLAATQLAIPFNPVPPPERNVLVAAASLIAAAWLVWAGEPLPQPRLSLLAHACWMVALLAPAIVSATFRPSALGAIAVPHQLPLKVLAGVLYLLCLPAVLGVPGPGTPLRILLWLPLCGLFASLFFPPAADDLAGLARFFGAVVAAALVAAALGGLLRRRPGPTPWAFYTRLVAPLAALTLAVAAATTIAG